MLRNLDTDFLGALQALDRCHLVTGTLQLQGLWMHLAGIMGCSGGAGPVSGTPLFEHPLVSVSVSLQETHLLNLYTRTPFS